ncbi:single-stranded DNA-binding protein [Listeria monocytogenes]|nr:single-stranded DNA-binding protein [Listeria monocytogenes]
MMNRVVLVGRLANDPELKYTPSGVAVATFRLAVNRPFKNQNGDQEADFINIVVWRKPAENAANYLRKGSLAGVDGRVQTRNYEGQDGKRVYVTEVVAESVQFLEPKNSAGGSQGASNQNEGKYSSSNQNEPQRAGNQSQAGDKPIEINDDDLPF